MQGPGGPGGDFPRLMCRLTSSQVDQEVKGRYIKLLAEAAITQQPRRLLPVTGIFISFSMLEREQHTHTHTHKTHTVHLQAALNSDWE